MTVVLETTIHRFVGDTGDTKPTGVPVGSTYLDRQTSILYVTYDGTNWVAKDNLVKLVAGTAIAGKVGIDQATANANEVVVKSITAGTNTIGAVRDAGPSWTSASQTTTSADMTGAADLTAAPTAGQKIVIDDVIASSDTALYIDLLEETSGTLIARLFFAAGSTAQVTTRGKLKLATADKKLRGDASLAGNVAITVLYHSEA